MKKIQAKLDIVLTIKNPENIQLFHVQNMRNHLMGSIKYLSTGKTALHSTWVLDNILKK
jgi:1,5-anhydro-D-fructose reductase (1,5-anhydro-D-mannitol-forming)